MHTNALLAPLAAVAVLATGAAPLAGAPPIDDIGIVIEAEFACEPDGTFLVEWVVGNVTEDLVFINSAEVRGAISPAPVTITPNPIVSAGLGAVTIEVPGATAGQLELDVDYQIGLTTSENSGFVTLPGDCTSIEGAATTSTTATPTTASVAASSPVAPSTSTTAPVPAPRAAAVAARPAFTG